MTDGFQTTDVFFVAAMLYVYTEDALLKVEVTPDRFGRDRNATYTLDIPSHEAQKYRAEFDRGELAITDLLSYVRTYTWLTRKLRAMRKNGETSYCGPAWIEGRG